MKGVLRKILNAEAKMIVFIPTVLGIAVFNSIQLRNKADEGGKDRENIKAIAWAIGEEIKDRLNTIEEEYAERISAVESSVSTLSGIVNGYHLQMDEKTQIISDSLTINLSLISHSQNQFRNKLNTISQNLEETFQAQMTLITQEDKKLQNFITSIRDSLSIELDIQKSAINLFVKTNNLRKSEVDRKLLALKEDMKSIIPQGAILAYDGSSHIPRGWELDNRSKGRFIRGAEQNKVLGTFGGTNSGEHSHKLGKDFFDFFTIEKNKVFSSDKVLVPNTSGRESVSTIKSSSFSHDHRFSKPRYPIKIGGQTGGQDNRPAFVSYYYIRKTD